MGPIGKLEAETLITAPADKFYELFRSRPHHVSNLSPEKIQKVDLHKGEWGKPGSIIEWSYVFDGNNQAAKEIVEDIDVENKSITFKVIEGDILKQYKNFKIVLQVTPKKKETLVRWSLEYDNVNEDTPTPVKLLEYLIHISHEIDGHL